MMKITFVFVLGPHTTLLVVFELDKRQCTFI